MPSRAPGGEEHGRGRDRESIAWATVLRGALYWRRVPGAKALTTSSTSERGSRVPSSTRSAVTLSAWWTSFSVECASALARFVASWRTSTLACLTARCRNVRKGIDGALRDG